MKKQVYLGAILVCLFLGVTSKAYAWHHYTRSDMNLVLSVVGESWGNFTSQCEAAGYLVTPFSILGPTRNELGSLTGDPDLYGSLEKQCYDSSGETVLDALGNRAEASEVVLGLNVASRRIEDWRTRHASGVMRRGVVHLQEMSGYVIYYPGLSNTRGTTLHVMRIGTAYTTLQMRSRFGREWTPMFTNVHRFLGVVQYLRFVQRIQ